MNRISHVVTDALIDAIIHAKPQDFPIEALLVERSGLIDMLRRSLSDMHERRRLVAGTSAEPAIVQRINYWQEVLGWVQARGGDELVLMNRSCSS